MPTQCNQTWDSDGNLINEEWVEVPEPEAPTLSEFTIDELVEILQKRLESNE